MQNSASRESASIDILNLMIEHPELEQLLDDIEFSMTQIMHGKDDREIGIAEAMLAYDLRQMIPDMVAAFENRGYLTTVERQDQAVKETAKEGADDGKH